MIITRKTIAREIQEWRKYYADDNRWQSERGYAASQSRATINERATKKAWDGFIPAYGWPGGYDMAYYPTDEFGSLEGDVLCWGCAREFLKNNKAVAPDAGYGLDAQSCDGYEGNDSTDHLYCDDCHGVICEAWQREEEEEETEEEEPPAISEYRARIEAMSEDEVARIGVFN